MSLLPRFRPRLVDTLRGYSGSDFAADAIAGLTVGIVALPLAMAFAIASGVPPQAGLITAVIAGFLISAFGGSRVQIGGPTGAFIVIVSGIVTTYGVENLHICTLMAGLMLLLMGLTRLGSAIKFIPYPVTMGFTSGIAVLICSTQVKDFLGLQIENVPSDFVAKVGALLGGITTWQGPTAALALGSFLLILLWPRQIGRRVPGSVVALILGTGLVVVCKLPVETIGSRFGGIPQGIPPFHFPTLEWENVRHLFLPAFTIALLGAIESLLSAVVADGMIDERHDSNQELMAQGLANLCAPLFGGIPATGAIARTATNVKSGARSPVAGMLHALTLLLILIVAAPLAKFIPLATLSAVLVVVAFNMGEWHNFRHLSRWPRSDAAVFLTAFTLTVLVDLTVAVEVGVVLAMALFIKRVSENSEITLVDPDTETEGPHHSLLGKDIPEGVVVYRIFGAFFFGAADKLEYALKRAEQLPDVLILRLRKVISIDATGLNALEDLHEKLALRGKHLIISAPQPQPLATMRKAGLITRLGEENVCPHIDAALARARQILGEIPPG